MCPGFWVHISTIHVSVSSFSYSYLYVLLPEAEFLSASIRFTKISSEYLETKYPDSQSDKMLPVPDDSSSLEFPSATSFS